MATSATRSTTTARSRQLGWAIVGLCAATLVVSYVHVGDQPAGDISGATLALLCVGGLAFACLKGTSAVTSNSARVAAPSFLTAAVVLLALALLAATLGGVSAVLWLSVGAGAAFGLASVPGIAR